MNQNIGKRRSFIWVIQPLYERQDHGFMQFRAQGGGPDEPPPFEPGSGSSLKSSTPSSLRVGFRARTLSPKLGFAEV